MLAGKIAAMAAVLIIAVIAILVTVAITGVWNAGEDMGIWDEWD